MRGKTTRIAAATVLLAMIAGCGTVETDERTGQRAGSGAAAGAAAGAAVGILTGGFLAKTVAGAAVGGAGGFIYDQARKEGERDD